MYFQVLAGFVDPGMQQRVGDVFAELTQLPSTVARNATHQRVRGRHHVLARHAALCVPTQTTLA